MKYAPPPRISVLVLIALTDMEVMTVIAFATKRTFTARRIPACPTTKGARRNMITPRIVRTLGVNTPPNVPSRLPWDAASSSIFFSRRETTRPFITREAPEEEEPQRLSL